MGEPVRRASTAGTGTNTRPCRVRTMPLPRAGGEATILTRESRWTSAAALIRSTTVSTPLSSWRCSSSSPWTCASAAAMLAATAATASTTRGSSVDARAAADASP